LQLTQFSDYALRVAIYLAAHPGEMASVGEISASYRISRNHLAKVVQRLAELGVVSSTKGRGGGLRLARPPEEINVGWLVRQTEPHLDIVECFDPTTNTCPIARVCGLKTALSRAQVAFLAVLDEYTLDSFRPERRQLVAIWDAVQGKADRRPDPC
jgi:Rrf2 family nitric oxide-sensitive transcriptional repressor